MLKRQFILTLFLLPLFGSLYAQTASVTKAEAVALGQKLEKEVNSGNALTLFLTIDSTTFYGKIQAGSTVARDTAFMKGFLGSFSLTALAAPVQEAVNKGSFRFLHSYEKEGNEHLLFRLLPGGGINYYDLTLMKSFGVVKIADILFYINGENLTVTLTNLIETMVANINNEDDLNGLRSTMFKLLALKRQGDWAGVKSTFDQLNDKFRHDKSLQIFNLIACQHIDNPTYKKALEQYANDFPDATNAYLMMIDMYALNGEYEKAIGAINKIDSITGGDPALDYFRANQYTNMKRTDSAIHYYSKVFAYDPSLTNNVKRLVECYENAGDKEKAKKVLEVYQKTLGVKPGFIESLHTEFPDLK